MELNIYCDGGARGNPGIGACAFVVFSSSGKILKRFGKFLGTITNNQAEYQGVIEALSWLSENEKTLNVSIINIFLDSVLVVSQLNGLFKIKNSTLRILLLSVREKEAQIHSKIIYKQIPREKNELADQLVNQTLNQQ